MVKVLFVCTGNICRSPTAEAVLRAQVLHSELAGQIKVDSAGTENYHIGDPPDPRSIEVARKRGYVLDSLRARQVRARDYETFDYIVAMDRGHLRRLQRACPPELRDRLSLFMEYAQRGEIKDVPDPYYGDEGDFIHVLDLIEDGAAGLLATIRGR